MILSVLNIYNITKGQLNMCFAVGFLCHTDTANMVTLSPFTVGGRLNVPLCALFHAGTSRHHSRTSTFCKTARKLARLKKIQIPRQDYKPQRRRESDTKLMTQTTLPWMPPDWEIYFSMLEKWHVVIHFHIHTIIPIRITDKQILCHKHCLKII